MPAPVTLHIYDVGDQKAVTNVNKLLKPIGTGAFHGAVEVYGEEWSYGYIDEGTGVFSNPPKECSMHTYRESVPMGETKLSEEEVGKLIKEMQDAWPGEDYDLLRHNCCTFSDALCVKLGVGNAPKWVTNLAGAGATLEDGFKAVHSKAQSAAIVAAAKADEIDAKYQIRSKTEAKAKDIAKFSQDMDQKYGISVGAQNALDKANAKFKELDDKHKITETGQAAVKQAGKTGQSLVGKVSAWWSGRPTSAGSSSSNSKK
jgi:hypothetical protein